MTSHFTVTTESGKTAIDLNNWDLWHFQHNVGKAAAEKMSFVTALSQTVYNTNKRKTLMISIVHNGVHSTIQLPERGAPWSSEAPWGCRAPGTMS